MSQDQLRPEGELREQHANWARAHARLFNAPKPPPKPRKPRPVSPFIRDERPRWKRLFTRAIEEIDASGAVVDSVLMPAWKRIALEVARKHKVSMTDLLSARRTHGIVVARHEVFWRCKTETTMSLPAIGRQFGGKDHTTVLHGINRHEQRMKEAADGSW